LSSLSLRLALSVLGQSRRGGGALQKELFADKIKGSRRKHKANRANEMMG